MSKMRLGRIIRLNGEALRVLAVLPHEVTLEICRTGNLTTIPRKDAQSAPVGTILQPSVEPSPRRRSKRRDASMRVYLANLGFGHFKVGVTKDVRRRMRALRTACLVEPRVVRTWDASDRQARDIESRVIMEVRGRGWQSIGGGTEVFRCESAKRATQLVDACV